MDLISKNAEKVSMKWSKTDSLSLPFEDFFPCFSTLCVLVCVRSCVGGSSKIQTQKSTLPLMIQNATLQPKIVMTFRIYTTQCTHAGRHTWNYNHFPLGRPHTFSLSCESTILLSCWKNEFGCQLLFYENGLSYI